MYGQQPQQPQAVDHILNSLSCYADKARIRADVFALQSRVPNCLQPKQGTLGAFALASVFHQFRLLTDGRSHAVQCTTQAM